MSLRPNSGVKLDGVEELTSLSANHIYYGQDREANQGFLRRRLSADHGTAFSSATNQGRQLSRQASQDELQPRSRKFLISVDTALEQLLASEDSDRNEQITIDDIGAKKFRLGTVESTGSTYKHVRGTYMLSNLLQELSLAKGFGRKQIILDEARLSENPVSRLSRAISTFFWDNLTRRIDAGNIDIVALDAKDWTEDPRPRIYVPRGAPEQFDYYTRLAGQRPEMRLDVQWLPHEPVTGDYVRDLNAKPGLLAVAMEEVLDYKNGLKTLRGLPFVVPGGRFNELYGWDSYMITLGLLVNDRVDLAKAMVTHFCFCIRHYGKIFNANRSYYLGRSQPPFLTDMALRVYERIKTEKGALEFLQTAILAAIKEYYGIWMAAPRLDPETDLSRYRPVGVGVPPETEASHFVHVLRPYAEKHGMSHDTFVAAYNSGKVKEPQLDDYFLHDRAVRESGHDTSYRLEHVAANLATIDLNSLLYKYETDISYAIRTLFHGKLMIPAEFCAEGMQPNTIETSVIWDRRAEKRATTVNSLMWNETEGMYFDYDTVEKRLTTYESVTTIWALWAGLAPPSRAATVVEKALPKFECLGGLVSGTEKSRGQVGVDRPSRQWDYPYGWAPHQMLAWDGLLKYGYKPEAERLIYKWLFMLTKAFADFNGVVVEKYDVTAPVYAHRVDAEYGNVGADFKGVAREG